jgi:hypothetical protein
VCERRGYYELLSPQGDSIGFEAHRMKTQEGWLATEFRKTKKSTSDKNNKHQLFDSVSFG